MTSHFVTQNMLVFENSSSTRIFLALQKTADLGGLFPHDKVFSFVAKIVCLSKQVSYVSPSKSLLYCMAQLPTYYPKLHTEGQKDNFEKQYR